MTSWLLTQYTFYLENGYTVLSGNNNKNWSYVFSTKVGVVLALIIIDLHLLEIMDIDSLNWMFVYIYMHIKACIL